MIAELAGAYVAGQHQITAAQLRALVHGVDLNTVTSEATDALRQVKAYLEWSDDPLPEVAQARGEQDKFPRLIDLSRRYPECTAFYLNEADLNSSTLWRWSNGKSRPSKYIATSIVGDIKPLLVTALWNLCDKHGLCKARVERHETDPVLEAAGNALRSVGEKAANHLARARKQVTARWTQPA